MGLFYHLGCSSGPICLATPLLVLMATLTHHVMPGAEVTAFCHLSHCQLIIKYKQDEPTCELIQCDDEVEIV